MAISMNTKAAGSLWQVPLLLLLAAAAGLGINALRSDGIPLVGRWTPEARLETSEGTSLAVPLEEARALNASGEAVFIDARPADLYAEGHIAGALSLPWNDVHQRFPEVADRLLPDQPIIVYCDGANCNLSKELALFLKDMGFDNSRVLVDGWGNWQRHHLPVEHD